MPTKVSIIKFITVVILTLYVCTRDRFPDTRKPNNYIKDGQFRLYLRACAHLIPCAHASTGIQIKLMMWCYLHVQADFMSYFLHLQYVSVDSVLH